MRIIFLILLVITLAACTTVYVNKDKTCVEHWYGKTECVRYHR
jgi:hypothetical protein